MHMSENELQYVQKQLTVVQSELGMLSAEASDAVDMLACESELQKAGTILSRLLSQVSTRFTRIFSALDRADLRQAYPYSLAASDDGEPLSHVDVILTEDRRVVFLFPLLTGKVSASSRLRGELKRLYHIGSAVQMEAQRCGKPIPSFDRYHLSFYHIYPCNFCKRLIKDNDNYDYKRCIDAITDALAITDDALRCELSFATFQSDKIKSGTYCIVSELGGTEHGLDDLIRLTAGY